MANTSFYGLTGTTATVQNTIQTSVTAAKTSETNAAASAAAALLSKNAAAASATTAQNGLGTIAVNVATTNTNATNTSANAVSTAADAVQTAADRVQTGLDRASVTSSAATVASSATQVTTDAAQVAADRIQTGTDAATASAAAAATAGVTASAAQVATDAAQVATDSAQVAADRIQTGLDASNLSTSVTSAQTAQAAAELALDQFTDQYLGPKAAVPTTDNDGNALVSGALVFDTTAGAMKVWDGSSWTAAYISASGSGALLTANDLSDLASASSARVNLGLGSAATTASTDYATAAQGALAATATQPADNISTLTNDSGFTTYTADQAVDTTSSPTFVAVNGRDVAVDGTKLDTIETSATADQTGAEIKAAYEAEADTNAFTDAEKTKLTAIETSATADQTGAEIKAAYEAEANTNAYTDAEKTKLTGIEASADVTDATNVAAAGALMTTGGSVTGNVSFDDNDKAIFGAGSDLEIYHDGSDSYIIDNGTGDLVINTNGNAISLNTNGGGEYGLRVINNGAVNLYHDNSLKLATTATGVDVTGAISTNKGSAGTLATFSDGVNSNFIVETSSLLTTIGQGGGSASLALKANNTEALRISAAGNVGIGTVSPAQRLHFVGGAVQFQNTQSTYLQINTSDTHLYTSGSHPLRFGTNGIERLRIDGATGSVGINGSAVAATQTANVGASAAPDMSTYQNFVWTLSNNTTLDNPSTEKVGQVGFFVFVQDAVGSRTLSLGSEYKTAGAAGITLSTTANAVDIVPYVVQASGSILLGAPQLEFA